MDRGGVIVEWISVKDRLPEIVSDKYYGNTFSELVSASVGEKILPFHVRRYFLGGFVKGDFSNGDLPSDYDFGGNITHWMPLPEPPK